MNAIVRPAANVFPTMSTPPAGAFSVALRHCQIGDVMIVMHADVMLMWFVFDLLVMISVCAPSPSCRPGSSGPDDGDAVMISATMMRRICSTAFSSPVSMELIVLAAHCWLHCVLPSMAALSNVSWGSANSWWVLDANWCVQNDDACDALRVMIVVMCLG